MNIIFNKKKRVTMEALPDEVVNIGLWRLPYIKCCGYPTVLRSFINMYRNRVS